MSRRVVGVVLAAICQALYGAEVEAPKAARSVHLGYVLPKSQEREDSFGTDFFGDVTVDASTAGSYFMACGFSGGYCGIQELGGGKKIVIFSIWDPGNQNDPKTVSEDKQVKVLFAGEGVNVSRFGGEGTGGKSIFPYDWKIGETYRFWIHFENAAEGSRYSGYFYSAALGQWKHLASFETPVKREGLKGLYSFIEDFRRDGASVKEERRARFGNGWLKLGSGRWLSLTQAKFTADGTPLENNDAGEKGGEFYLATGGGIKRSRELNTLIARGAEGRP